METIGITEAAQRLGVSERTVYRLLRSGKLRRHSVSDTNDRHVRLIMDEILISNLKTRLEESKSDLDVSDIVSDNDGQEELKRLREELASKDTQIAELIASQREMMQTIQRLQEQMFELARLVLSHNAANGTAAAPASSRAQNKESRPSPTRFWGLLRRNDKNVEAE